MISRVIFSGGILSLQNQKLFPQTGGRSFKVGSFIARFDLCGGLVWKRESRRFQWFKTAQKL